MCAVGAVWQESAEGSGPEDLSQSGGKRSASRQWPKDLCRGLRRAEQESPSEAVGLKDLSLGSMSRTLDKRPGD